MNIQWVRQWVASLGESQVTARDLQERFGGELRAQPPNQALLRWSSGDAERAELVLAKDRDPEAPVVRVTLIFNPQCALNLGALAEEFGRYEVVPEDTEKAAPAELVSFGWIRRPAEGVEILLRARVSRPLTPLSRVRSLLLVRSPLQTR